MRLVLGLAAASAALLAAASAGAQDRYPPSTYDRNYGAPSSQPGYPSSSYPRSGYAQSGDRQDGGYPQPGYDRGGQGAYDRTGPSGGAGSGADPDLARELNLSASQRTAYRDYQAAFAPDEARDRQEEDEQRRMAAMTTPQRLEAARAAMDRDRTEFERTASATRRFYAQLSPAQQRSFDRLTAPPPEEDGDDGGPNPRDPAARPPR